MTALIPPQPPRVPIGETPDGVPVFLRDEWARYFVVDLFRRVGGYNAATNNELVVDLHDDAGIEEMKADLIALMNALGQSPPAIEQKQESEQAPPGAFFIVSADEYSRLNSLEDSIKGLEDRIAGLEQGPML